MRGEEGEVTRDRQEDSAKETVTRCDTHHQTKRGNDNKGRGDEWKEAVRDAAVASAQRRSLAGRSVSSRDQQTAALAPASISLALSGHTPCVDLCLN